MKFHIAILSSVALLAGCAWLPTFRQISDAEIAVLKQDIQNEFGIQVVEGPDGARWGSELIAVQDALRKVDRTFLSKQPIRRLKRVRQASPTAPEFFDATAQEIGLQDGAYMGNGAYNDEAIAMATLHAVALAWVSNPVDLEAFRLMVSSGKAGVAASALMNRPGASRNLEKVGAFATLSEWKAQGPGGQTPYGVSEAYDLPFTYRREHRDREDWREEFTHDRQKQDPRSDLAQAFACTLLHPETMLRDAPRKAAFVKRAILAQP
ncbi:hypothetical protein D3C86_516710 [compost metagenome]